MDSNGLPSLLVDAARAAAREDGVASPKDDLSKLKPNQPNHLAGLLPNGSAQLAPPQINDGSALSNVQNNQNALKNQNALALNQRPQDDEEEEEAEEEPVSSSQPLRRGKWTAEEEAYASRLIVEFKAGLLPLTDGTTLRTFLSKLLNCDPMRISKKFVGSNCIGKQVFRRKSADVSNLTPEQIQRTRMELSELEKRFLDRVTKGGSSKGEKHSRGHSPPSERAEKKMKLSANKDIQASMVGGLGGGLAPGANLGNMNKSAAAAGRAMLQGGTGGGANGAQFQESQAGMFNSGAAAGGGLNLPGMGHAGGLGNMNPSLDINALMLQTGMTPEQISQLAQNKGLSSSASLANMLGKKRSFDGLMSLDFQSMQSIDNLANLIQHGMPNQGSNGQMKNWDWNNPAPQAGLAGMQGMQNAQGGLGSFGNSGLGNLSSSMLALNRAQNGANAGGLGGQGNSAFGDLLGNSYQNSLLQNLQQAQQQQQRLPQHGMGQLSQLQGLTNVNAGGQHQRLENLLQGMGGAPSGANSFESLLQSVQNGNSNQMGGGNDFNAFSLMGLQGGMQQPNLMGLNNSFGGNAFGGLSQGNPMMAALAQQQMFHQAKVGGSNTGMSGLLPQQGQLGGMGGGMGMGSLGGMDLSNLNLSDPNTAALVQQLLSQQQCGGGWALSGLGQTNQMNQSQLNQPQGGSGVSNDAPQASNDNFDEQGGGGSQEGNQSADV